MGCANLSFENIYLMSRLTLHVSSSEGPQSIIMASQDTYFGFETRKFSTRADGQAHPAYTKALSEKVCSVCGSHTYCYPSFLPEAEVVLESIPLQLPVCHYCPHSFEEATRDQGLAAHHFYGLGPISHWSDTIRILSPDRFSALSRLASDISNPALFFAKHKLGQELMIDGPSYVNNGVAVLSAYMNRPS